MACTSEEQIFTDEVYEKSHDAKVSFSLMLPFRMQTRALSEQDENAIQQVRLLMFKNTSGIMTYCMGVNGSNIHSNSLSQKTFDAILPAGEYDIVVLANAQDIADGSNISLGDTKENVLKALVKKNAGKWNENSIPMWGRIDNLTIHSETDFNNNSYSVEMTRMLAKIDIETLASASADFSLTDIRLYNYSSQGALVPDPATWSSDNMAVSPTQPSAPGGYAAVSSPLIFDASDGVTTNGCKQIIYTCEAPAGSAENLSANTCIVIGGSYRGEATSYYKVDFAGEENNRRVFLPLLRNNYYLINIIRVSGNGYPTPEIALQSPSVNINTSFLYWTEQNMNNVVFDGKYMLGVSTGRLTLPSDAHTTTGSDNTLNIRSTMPAGWEIEKITDASGMAGTAPWLTLNLLADASGAAKAVTVFTEKNTSMSNRTAYIYIRSGNLRYCVEVTQETVPGFYIEVTDLSTGQPVDLYDFTYQAGQVKEFRVVWKPATIKVTVYVTNPGTAFAGTGAPGNNSQLTGGSKTYTITGNGSTINRLTKLDFALTDGTRTEVKTLFLRQKQ
jgi:hypothetical protein